MYSVKGDSKKTGNLRRKVTTRRFPETIVVVEKQYVIHILSVCVCVCVCVSCVSVALVVRHAKRVC
jgi:hypothetical protein